MRLFGLWAGLVSNLHEDREDQAVPWSMVADTFPNLKGAALRVFSLAFPFVPVTSQEARAGGSETKSPRERESFRCKTK